MDDKLIASTAERGWEVYKKSWNQRTIEIQRKMIHLLFFNVLDKDIPSFSKLDKGAAEVCFVCSSRYMTYFEQLAFPNLFNVDYLNDYEHEGRQIFFHKAIFLILVSAGVWRALSFHGMLQKKESFVVIASRSYHAGLISS